MIVTLIPFFLAASIGIRENDWKYGPEVIYDVKVNSVSYPFGKLEKFATFNMTTKLNCRPKFNSSLICSFNEPNVTIRGTNNSEKIVQHDEIRDGESFELKFVAQGLEEIVVPSSIDTTRLDIIRALVAQLNIGADLSTLMSDNEFDIAENFTTGSCKTHYVIGTSRNEASLNNARTRMPREIVILPGMSSIEQGEVKQIQRIRNLEECDYRVDYFFGSREGQRATTSNIETRIKKSQSKMIIETKDFTSFTENTIAISSKLNSHGNNLVERIILSLADIIPARGPLPTISEASTASIFPGRWLHADSSELEDSSEEKI